MSSDLEIIKQLEKDLKAEFHEIEERYPDESDAWFLGFMDGYGKSCYVLDKKNNVLGLSLIIW